MSPRQTQVTPDEKNTIQWTDNRIPRRGPDAINDRGVVADARTQRDRINKLLSDEGYKQFIQKHPELEFKNLFESTSFKAADGKTYNLKAILSDNTPSRAEVEAIGDAAAIMQGKMINVALVHKGLAPRAFSFDDPRKMRGTSKNNWQGELEWFLTSPQAKEIGYVNVKGECRAQTIEQMRHNGDPRFPVAPPATENPPAPKPFTYNVQDRKISDTPGVPTVTTSTVAGGGARPEAVETPNMPDVRNPRGRRNFPLPLPGLGIGSISECINPCTGLWRVNR